MIYQSVRPITRMAFYVYFRKIYLSGAHRIPRNAPVILAANHPTGFTEPCIMACFLDRPLYFLVRGDFFVKPLYNYLLRSLHMLPVYRLRDGGYKKLKNNYSTFSACFEALHHGKPLMIFAEGNAKYEKRLRPLQKGTARIAFGTLEKYPELEDVYVVPVGVTYTDAHRFRSEVMVECGKPISVRQFQSEYRENSVQGMNQFTEYLSGAMQECIVQIDEPDDDELVEQLLTLDRSERPTWPWPTFVPSDWALRREQALADMVNLLPEEEKWELKNEVQDYFQALKALKVEDRALYFSQDQPRWLPALLALGLPFYLLGYLLNFLPLRIATFITNTNVKRIEFWPPVRLASGMGAYLIYFLFVFILCLAGFGWAGIPIALLFPLLGWLALRYGDLYEQWRVSRQAIKVDNASLEALRTKRRQIGTMIERVKNPY